MKNKISAGSYPGTRDFYPQEMRFREMMFSMIEDVLIDFAYEKMSGPLLENFAIYAEKSGEEIAEKQLYVFTDKGDRRVAIRPELTPTVARMFAARINEMASVQRWYSIENFMRYERPQKGRLREFWQVNVDLIGARGAFADFELLRVAQAIFTNFGATTAMYAININHRGFVRDLLVLYVGVSDEKVEPIAKIFDKKAKISQEIFETLLSEQHLTQEQIQKIINIFTLSFEECLKFVPESVGGLELQNIFELGHDVFGDQNPLVFNFSVVRGLAYYTGLVFEAFDKNPENPRALFGGGRYDNLVELFHKNNVSGVGFALGDVTFEAFLRSHNLLNDDDLLVERHVIATDGEVPAAFFHRIADHLKSVQEIFWECVELMRSLPQNETLSRVLEHLRKNAYFDAEKYQEIEKNTDRFLSEAQSRHFIVEIYPDPSISLSKQLQYANKAGADYVWICGDRELKRGIIKRKNMITGTEMEFDLTTFEFNIFEY